MKLKIIFICTYSMFMSFSLIAHAETVTKNTSTDEENGIVRQVQYYNNQEDNSYDSSATPNHVYMAPPYMKTMPPNSRQEYTQPTIIDKDKLQLREDEESLKNAYDHLNYEKTNPAHVGIELYHHNINESTKIVNYYEQIVDKDKHQLETDMNYSQ